MLVSGTVHSPPRSQLEAVARHMYTSHANPTHRLRFSRNDLLNAKVPLIRTRSPFSDGPGVPREEVGETEMAGNQPNCHEKAYMPSSRCIFRKILLLFLHLITVPDD